MTSLKTAVVNIFLPNVSIIISRVFSRFSLIKHAPPTFLPTNACMYQKAVFHKNLIHEILLIVFLRSLYPRNTRSTYSTNGGPLTRSSNYLNCYREDMNAIYKSLKTTVVHACMVSRALGLGSAIIDKHDVNY